MMSSTGADTAFSTAGGDSDESVMSSRIRRGCNSLMAGPRQRKGHSCERLRLRPIRMGGIYPENPHLAREKFELLQRAPERRIVGVAVHVGQELSRRELPA